MTTVASNIDIGKLAQALRSNQPFDIKQLVSDPSVRSQFQKVAQDRLLSADEYAQFKSITQTSGRYKPNRFSANASAFIDKRGAYGKRAAFMIIALERAGKHKLAADLLHKLFKPVAKTETKRQGMSIDGN